MYFRLNNFVNFIEGENCTIFDTITKKLFIFDEETSKLLSHLEENNKIEGFYDFTEKKELIIKFLNKIEELKLGKKYDKKVYIDKYMITSPKDNYMDFSPEYNKVSWQITDTCNLNCKFCANKNMKTWLGCKSCNLDYKNSNRSMNLDIEDILTQLRNLNVKELVIKGGNPLMSMPLLSMIVKLANEIIPESKIRIITNGGSNAFNHIVKLSELNNNVEFDIVLFGTSNNDYEICLNEKDVLKHQLDLLNKLYSKNILFNITIIESEYMISSVQENIKYIKDKWEKTPTFVQALDINKNTKLKHIENKHKYINPVDNMQQLYYQNKYNTCLLNYFHIDITGNILPCEGINDPIGNLYEDSLNKILRRRKLYEYWFLNKNKITYCKDCGMKSFCSDCSIFEVDQNLHNKYCPITDNDLSDVYNINFYSGPNKFIRKISIKDF